MNQEHIVKSYDSELKRLNQLVYEMGCLVEIQLEKAIEAVTLRDSIKAHEVITADPEVDQQEFIIDQFSVRLLALRQPMASDLRHVVAALKISSHLERIADYAANVAKRCVSLNQVPIIPLIYELPKIAKMVQSMVREVLEAYKKLDDARTTQVWRQDAEVDEMYGHLLHELLTYMTQNPNSISSCTHILFMAKNIERIGDHVTNIAEAIHFITHGRPFNEPRPKVEDARLGLLLPTYISPE